MSKWIGYAVSVRCGEPLGCYQGTILDADGTTITLTKAFRNGFPYPKSQVTLNAADIKELKIIEARNEAASLAHSTVAVAKAGRKASRATVCENLQANHSNSDSYKQSHPVASNQSTPGAVCTKGSSNRSGPTPARSKPIDIQPVRANKNNNHAGSYGPAGSTPKGRGGGAGAGAGGEKARRRNEACFGDEADPALDRDFDFEGNLALFDKRALWDQMNSQKPDLVRQTDEVAKFRHDENVLGGGGGAGAGGAGRGVEVPPPLRAARGYVTDEGARVPAVRAAVRARLWRDLAAHGLHTCAVTLLARGAADVCVRLVGGGRRLEARNRHQAPAVCVLAGAHGPGAAAALTAARLLASHNARVAALRPSGAVDEGVERELAALALSDVTLVERAELLPRPDVVLLALHDETRPEPTLVHSECISWARTTRAPVVAVEPAAEGAGPACRAALWALLPGGAGVGVGGGGGGGAGGAAGELGRVFLVDVAPPPRLFRPLGIRYRPPFGAAPLLPLHPADDDE